MKKVLGIVAVVFAVIFVVGLFGGDPAPASNPVITKEDVSLTTAKLTPPRIIYKDVIDNSTEEETEEVTTRPNKTQDNGRDYLLNTNSKKFHYPSCGSGQRTKASNRRDFHGTREELISMGYSPCGNCDP